MLPSIATLFWSSCPPNVGAGQSLSSTMWPPVIYKGICDTRYIPNSVGLENKWIFLWNRRTHQPKANPTQKNKVKSGILGHFFRGLGFILCRKQTTRKPNPTKNLRKHPNITPVCTLISVSNGPYITGQRGLFQPFCQRSWARVEHSSRGGKTSSEGLAGWSRGMISHALFHEYIPR